MLDLKNEALKKDVIKVLKMIKNKGSIMATGHISWREAEILVEYTINKVGIKKIILTHPIYNKIKMPLSVQKKLAKQGAYIEFCYFAYKNDSISINEIAKQIKSIGADSCVISSDVGQVYSKSPSEALEEFVNLLAKEGITEEEIVKMLVINPRSLLGIPV